MAALALVTTLGGPFAVAQPTENPGPRLSLDAGRVLLRGLAGTVAIDATGVVARPLSLQLEAIDARGGPRQPLGEGALGAGQNRLELPITVSTAWRGRLELIVTARGPDGRVLGVATTRVRMLSSLWAFVPPLLAIGLALALRQVIPALIAGVLAGTLLRSGFAWTEAPLRLLDFDL
ncbi:MAG: hypothetical protein JSV80_16405, partial [Acidobacteriota bacterium]